VEAAHTFQLGTKYSDVMPGADFVAEDGGEAVFSMGCYGMGVSRLLAVVAEEHHDELGLVWPLEAAPYRVHLAALGAGRAPEVAEAAEGLYRRLTDAGVEVLYDDRDVSPGVKFKDADLLGVPIRLVVGAKGLARGVLEWRSRSTGEERELALDSPIGDLVGG
jgi:prolyl-tRNA synthetase